MTAGTSLDQSLIERKLRAKRRRRQAILLAVVGLICFYLMRLITLDRGAIAEEYGEQSMYQNSTTKVNKANAEGEDARPKGKIEYLTFDDGPSEWTGKFLDVLQQHGVKATFFMQGSQLQRNSLQSDVKRAVSEGHYVGAHSMTHQNKKLYEDGQFVSEMKASLALIHDITGENPHLVRPPYGSVPGLNDKKLRDQIAQEGMKLWDWTIESNDWNLKDRPEQIVENIKKATKVDLEVVLMHEKPQTLQVLPEIIAFYQKEGYRFGVYSDNTHFHMNFQRDHRL